jgi:hypothetical protein
MRTHGEVTASCMLRHGVSGVVRRHTLVDEQPGIKLSNLPARTLDDRRCVEQLGEPCGDVVEGVTLRWARYRDSARRGRVRNAESAGAGCDE